jgi:hypothetical protein
MHMDECRDGLCYVFLMNNCLYIVHTAKNRVLETILEGVLIQKHRRCSDPKTHDKSTATS